MTLREKICESGVNTLRELICVQGIGGGDVYINSDIIYLKDEEVTMLNTVDDTIMLVDMEETKIELFDITELENIEGDKIDV